MQKQEANHNLTRKKKMKTIRNVTYGTTEDRKQVELQYNTKNTLAKVRYEKLN